jgi:hypothetical protein
MVLKQSTAFVRPFYFGTTGQTVTVKLSKNSGSGTMTAWATAGGAVSEIGGAGNGLGWYSIALNSTTDTGTVGALAYNCTASSGGPVDFCDIVSTQVVSDFALDGSGRVMVSSPLRQNTAFAALFFMTQLGSNNPAPGLTVAGQRAFGIAGFNNVTGGIAEVGGAGNGAGWYVFNGTAADSANAVAGFKMTATGANDSEFTLWFQP